MKNGSGPRAGQRLLRLGDRVEPEALPSSEDMPPPRCASAAGLSLHADVAVPARDRKRFERLARYVARPPLAAERLTKLEDGQLCYRLRHRWRDGTIHIVLEPVALLERLAACIPIRQAKLSLKVQTRSISGNLDSTQRPD